MLHDVSEAAFRPAAQRNARAGSFREELEGDGTIGKGVLVQDFEHAVADRERLAVAGLDFCRAGSTENALAQRARRDRLLFEIAEQLAI